MSDQASSSKKRHGCLTFYLIFMIIINLYLVVAYSGLLIVALFIDQNITTVPDVAIWLYPIQLIMAILSLVFTIAIFLWKKWGFYGIAVLSGMSLVISVALEFAVVWTSATVLISFALLYGALQVGQDNKAWPQLE